MKTTFGPQKLMFPCPTGLIVTGTMEKANIVKPPIIKECPLNLECVLVSSGMFGTTNHFAGKIVETHIDTDKLSDTGDYTSFSIEAINPLIYIGGAREYRQIGKKTGDAYSIGKNLLQSD